MAILDKQGLQHYANKMCNADNRKVGSKSLPTALNDIDTAIDGFKTLFESEYGTPVNMKLSNNENIFGVGTGTYVDKRSEVENSFTDIELSGNSLVNLSVTKELLNQTSAHYGDIYLCELSRLKANTSYRLEYDFECNIDFTFNRCYLGYSDSKTSMKMESSIKFDAKKGKNILNFTLTQSELDIVINNNTNLKYFLVRVFIDSDKNEKTYSTKNIMVLEGDWTNKPLPQYFEGLKSIGEKEDGNHKISILSKGKNLFNISDTPTKSAGTSFEINKNSVIVTTTKDSTNYANVSFKIPLKPLLGKRISGSAKIEAIEGSLASAVVCSYEVTKDSFRYLTFDNKPANQLIPNSCYGDYLKFQLTNHNKGEVGIGKVKFSNIQLEISDISTDYESYKEDKKEISLNEPLRGLPNGVRDTIEKVNDEWKIVRRCGEVVLDGSENWTIMHLNATGIENYISFSIPFEHGIETKGVSLSYLDDKGFSTSVNSTVNITNSTTRGLARHSNGNLYLRIEKQALSSQNVEGFKQWLSQNPTKVIYELITPIIEDISPVTLQC